ncbi:5-formyltetrahydrofolate cyclo-ligase [Labilibaculum sp.]|uniref:5-formyltetrahydrofolate cyclo-ligase n=1 Tax=Labilibaculum sp. TaxID=2060723 RepID=UPI0035677718
MNGSKQTIDEEKKRVRKEIKVLKSKYTLEEKKVLSLPILKSLEQVPEFIRAKTVMLYWSMEDELPTHDFVCKWAHEKQIILPCVKGETLDLRVFEGVDLLVEGENYGILEPVGPVFMKEDEIDLIVVPGIAFDRENNRMGRGKAYYDRLLKSLSAYKLGLCFDFQMLEQVPVDEHDIKMDEIVFQIKKPVN